MKKGMYPRNQFEVIDQKARPQIKEEPQIIGERAISLESSNPDVMMCGCRCIEYCSCDCDRGGVVS